MLMHAVTRSLHSKGDACTDALAPQRSVAGLMHAPTWSVHSKTLQSTPKDSKAQHVIKANEIKTTDYFEDILKNYVYV